MNSISRRRALLLFGSVAALGTPALAQGTLPQVAVTKDPECGCCSGWVAHLRRAGFPVTVTNTADVTPLKRKLGVPDDLAACHTAQVAGYVIEGHVPAHAIRRLLQEKPKAVGLAVPGMPAGSPGMGAEEHEIYEVTMFGFGTTSSFGKYKGDKPV